MLRSHIKIALRALFRNKLYTCINIAGLSFGIASAILILAFVQDELSFDQFHANRDRLFRVIAVEKRSDGEVSTSAYQPVPLVPALKAEFPEIESAAQLLNARGTITIDGQTYGERFTYTHPSFLNMFSFPLINGDAETALQIQNSVVISADIAEKYFGANSALNQSLTVVDELGGKKDFIVTGVIKNAPRNSSITYDFLLPISQYPTYEKKRTRWTNFIGSVFVLLDQNSSVASLTSKTLPFVQKHFVEMIERNQARGLMSKESNAMQFRFQPLTQMHLDQSIGISEQPSSNPLYSYILSGIAVLVLLIACINFVTLAIGRSTARAKEVGVRKVLGAARLQLMKQFWGEAVLLSFFALLLGVVFAELALPVFNQLASKTLELNYLSNAFWSLALVLITLVVGLLAGGYPAAYLSRFRPVEVLKGTLKLGGQNWLSRTLVVFQFGLSIFLIICTLLMSSQHSFLMSKNIGFDSNEVLVIRSYSGSGTASEELLAKFRNELSGLPEIKGVSGVSSSFNRGWSLNGFEHEGVQRSTFVYRVDYDYIDVLDLKIKEGRSFRREMTSDKDEAIITNETFARELGWQEPIVGRRLSGWNEREMAEGPVVIGVVKDYHFLSLHQTIKPVLLMLDEDWPMGDFLVKIATTNVPEVIDKIEKIWSQVAPDTPFTYSFLDQDLERQYRKEQRWASIVKYSSLLAIFLACLGLFGLATLSVSKRTKELGIRKVLGATSSRIVYLMSSEFAKLVLLANIVATPIAWIAMNRWLQNFAYHIDIEIHPFLLAGLGACAIAVLSVSYQSVKAALANPVDSLRYE